MQPEHHNILLRRHSIWYALPLLIFVVSYHGIIAHIAGTWTTAYGSHGALIFAVSIYLVWVRRKEIRRLHADPALLSGGLLLGVGGFVFFAGVISSTLVVQMLSMIPVLLGMALLFGGFRYFRIFLLPVSYLVFLTGFVEQLLGNVAIYMQLITAWLAAGILGMTGMPVFREGTILELPHIALEVVRGCSGISHIVALLALAVPLAYLSQKTRPRKIILVLSALVIGLFANGMRIVLIGLFTKFFPEAGVHGPYETLSVTVVFFFGLLLLLLFNGVLARKGKKESLAAVNMDTPGGKGSKKMPPPSGSGSKTGFTRKQLASFIIGAAVFAVTFGLVQFYLPQPVSLDRPLDQFPNQLAGFTGKNIEDVDDRIRPFAAHSELFRKYENDSGISAVVYIGYFEQQDRDKKIIDYRRAWMHQEASRIQVNSESEMWINRTRMRDKLNPLDIYFWYSMDGRIITSQYAGKVFTFFNGLFKQRTNAAVIVISTQNEASDVMPVIAKLALAVEKHLKP